MSVDLKQNSDSSFGLSGVDAGDGGFIPVTLNYTAADVDKTIFTADRTYIVKAIRGRVDAAGTGGAATAVIRKVASGTAITSGVALNTGSFNFVGTANAQQTLALSAVQGALIIPAGTSIAVDITGTITTAAGNITVTLSPA